MKKTKFTEAKIVFPLHSADFGLTVAEVCREMGISEATCYKGFFLQTDTVGEFIFKPLLEALIARKRPDGSGLTALRLTS